VILIPDGLWASLLDEFARVPPTVERVAFLDGVREGDVAFVTTITIPDADLHPGFYDVSAEAMSQAGRHLREHGLARIAQVHTHGGSGCRHSGRDDDKAYSQRVGSVSIVLPHHAARRPGPTEGLVHVRFPDGWVPITPAETVTSIRIIPSLLDFRSPEWIASPIVTKETSVAVWRRLLRRANSWLPSQSRKR
jgi:hypothetical protein